MAHRLSAMRKKEARRAPLPRKVHIIGNRRQAALPARRVVFGRGAHSFVWTSAWCGQNPPLGEEEQQDAEGFR
jgi:hypothetical protein